MEELRFSDRKKLAEDGTLGPLDTDGVPKPLRMALKSAYQTAARAHAVGTQFDARLVASCAQHFGQEFYTVNFSSGTLSAFVAAPYTALEDVLDFVELLVEEATKTWVYNVDGGSRALQADADIETRVNRAFVRHRFGYRVDAGQVVRIGSPALDTAVVGPALLALRRPGWEEADRSYRDALHHRLGGPAERAAAITDAHAALEAGMKAAGLKGDRLSALAKSFRNSGLVLPQLEGVPEALDTLLKRSSSVRDPLGDVHGKEPGAGEVPDGVVDLVIHWTGAFIVYLSEAVERPANPATKSSRT